MRGYGAILAAALIVGPEFDYPTMERNLMLMMREVTSLRPHVLINYIIYGLTH